MRNVGFYKLLFSVSAATPLFLLVWDGWRGQLGANPVEFVLRTFGVLTLIFLLLTLAVTPARRLFHVNELIRIRRMLALWAFFFAVLHLLVYFYFDKESNFAAVVTDIGERPFVAVGMAAFALMVPLAITSTNRMVKRLGGRRWARLHRLTYLIAILGVIHFWMIVKSDVFYPAIFGMILVILLGARFLRKRKRTANGEA